MALVQRKNREDTTEPLSASPKSAQNSEEQVGKSSITKRNIIFAFIISYVLYYFVVILLNSESVTLSENSIYLKGNRHDVNNDFNGDKDPNGSVIYWKGNGHGVKIVFNTDIEGNYTLGPHHAVVSTRCNVPPLWIRIIGDVLMDVPLVEDVDVTLSKDVSFKWVGTFTVPIAGEFQVESHWHGCDAGEDNKDRYVETYQYFKASGKSNSTQNQEAALFVNGVWAKGKHVNIKNVDATNQSYIWADPDTLIRGKEFTPLEAPDGSVVLKESVVTENYGFYSFADLSNYELVCWVGSNSAAAIWRAFKSLRAQIFPHQRPFKFHYYGATSFVAPDTAWQDDTRFRKCKHILVSLDEPDEPLSQFEYTEQVGTFVKHLLHAFDEENTFPASIWMFTVNESAIGTKNCHSPYLKKSTNHPCNDALNEIFKKSAFPKRVRLLDNTDLSSPGRGKFMDEVFAAIALRIYVLVGKQVKAWRDAGISGGINGVTTNGVLKPNFEIVRYDWSQKLE
mmetsp:Transcript_3310/g.6872  ORF Transcript_3310/g.6872 Transcript_3310/m.6872 type:complete len:508 (-) Transcript_3310:83-1606(-)